METKKNGSNEMELEIRPEVDEDTMELEIRPEVDEDTMELEIRPEVDEDPMQIIIQNVGKRIEIIKADVDDILTPRLRMTLTDNVNTCMFILLDIRSEYTTGTTRERLERITRILDDTERHVLRYKNTERFVDMYLWIIHGLTTTYSDVLVQTQVNSIFDDVIAYANNGRSLAVEDYFTTERNPACYLKGVLQDGVYQGNKCLRDTTTPSSLQSKVNLYLVPATFFTLNLLEDEKFMVRQYLGLRRIRLRIANDDSNEEFYAIKETEILINYADLLNVIKPLHNYTIQDLIAHTLPMVKREQNVRRVLGLFSCRADEREYRNEQIGYLTTKQRIEGANRPSIVRIPSHIGTFRDYPTIPINVIPRSNYYMPLCIKLPQKITHCKKRWSALGGIVTRGCGINVLSYWNVIEKNRARALITGMDRRGTSMQKMLDIVYKQKMDIAELTDVPELSGDIRDTMIYRYENIYQVIAELFLTMSLLVGDVNNTFTIIKLYETFYNPNNQSELNQVGHTISLAIVYGNKMIVDPQQEIFDDIQGNDLAQLTNVIQTTIMHRYPTMRWSCLDVIMTSFDSFMGKTQTEQDNHPMSQRMSRRITGLRVPHQPSYIKFGGRLTRKRKTTKKRKPTKKRKTTRKKKVLGYYPCVKRYYL